MTSASVDRHQLAGGDEEGPALGSTAESEDHRSFATSVRAAVTASWTDDDLRLVGTTGDVVDDEAHWPLLIDLGLPAVPVAEDLGGFGGRWLDIVSATEEVGAALLPQPLAASNAATALLVRTGASSIGMLTRVATGEALLTVVADWCARSWSAPDSLSVRCAATGPIDVGMRVTVTGEVSRFLRPGADTLLVPTASPSGTIVVAIDRADCEVKARAGLDLLRPLGSVTFDGTPGIVVADTTSATVALSDAHAAAILVVTSEEVGICQRALDRAVDYARDREQFGKPIGAFQAVAHRLADVFVETELARSAARQLAVVLDAGRDPTEAANLAHHQGVRALQTASASLIQVLGGVGFTWESTAHHPFRKAGADAVLLGSASASLGSPSALSLNVPLRSTGPAAALTEFLEHELPLHRETWGTQDSFDARRAWQRRLHDGGWIGLGWPKAFGGKGLSVRDQVECERVLAAANAPGIAGVLGINNVGPTLVALGTPEQQQHLQRILSADEVWCQGFSEPGSGSDLASLRCRARSVGGEYVIDGQKIWTTDGMDATHIELMVRTDPESTRHKGITMMLVPLETPGITRRPIIQMDGTSGFAEVFFDDVHVPAAAILGEVGAGWSVSRTTLAYERTGVVVLAARLQQAATDVVAGIDESTLSAPIRAKLAETYARAQLLDFHGTRLLSAIEEGRPPGPEQSVVKLAWSQVTQSLGEVKLAAEGTNGLEPPAGVVAAYLRSRSATIAGGTTEIMKNVIAQRVLGLPR